MHESIERIEVGLEAYSPEVAPERGLEILRHVSEYDVPDAYPNRLSNLGDLDADAVDRAQYAFADHVPSDLSAYEGDPNAFTAGYDDFLQAVAVEFRADYDAVGDFLGAVGHVLTATSLDCENLTVEFDLAVDVTDRVDPRETDPPEAFLETVEAFPDEDRTELSVTTRRAVFDEFETADALEARLDEAVAHASGLVD